MVSYISRTQAHFVSKQKKSREIVALSKYLCQRGEGDLKVGPLKSHGQKRDEVVVD